MSFLIGVIIGAVIGIFIQYGISGRVNQQNTINVTTINTTYFDVQTNKAYPGGELKGFKGNIGKSAYYVFTVNYKNTTYSETIENISIVTTGFNVISITPSLPSIIQPSSAQTFDLVVGLPNTPYSGQLNLLILYKMNYEANSSRR